MKNNNAVDILVMQVFYFFVGSEIQELLRDLRKGIKNGGDAIYFQWGQNQELLKGLRRVRTTILLISFSFKILVMQFGQWYGFWRHQNQEWTQDSRKRKNLSKRDSREDWRVVRTLEEVVCMAQDHLHLGLITDQRQSGHS